MQNLMEKEVIQKTKDFLKFVESCSDELEKDLYLYSSLIEICKVLLSEIFLIEKKIIIRENRD